MEDGRLTFVIVSIGSNRVDAVEVGIWNYSGPLLCMAELKPSGSRKKEIF
jgi:hypothetical protein